MKEVLLGRKQAAGRKRHGRAWFSITRDYSSGTFGRTRSRDMQLQGEKALWSRNNTRWQLPPRGGQSPNGRDPQSKPPL